MSFLGVGFLSKGNASYFTETGFKSQLAYASQPLKFSKPQFHENYFKRAQDNSRNAVQTNQKSDQILLNDFLESSLKKIGFPAGYKIAGISDLQNVLLEKTEKFTPKDPSFNFNLGDKAFTVVLLNSEKKQPLLLFNVRNISFGNLVPGIEKTSLGAIGNLKSSYFILSSREIPAFELNSLKKVKSLTEIKTATDNIKIKPGFNFISEIEMSSLGQIIQDGLS